MTRLLGYKKSRQSKNPSGKVGGGGGGESGGYQNWRGRDRGRA